MRKTPITQEEFEKEFWLYPKRPRHRSKHMCLCNVFRCLGLYEEFKAFWDEINISNFLLAWLYLEEPSTTEEHAIFRLMIAQEFIEQFNESLKDFETGEKNGV